MVVIRLARGGAKKTPFYHIVVADSRKARGGRFIERLGYYNPLARGQETTLQVSEERVTYWVNNGAQPSDRVAHILKLGVAANKTQPKKSEAKTAQIDASRKAAAAKAKAAAETTTEAAL